MPVKQDNPLWNFWPRNRVRLSWMLLAALLLWVILTRPTVFSIAESTGFVAAVLAFLGVFVRSWSAGIVHKDHKLATTGPYSLCRHPLYLGSFLAVCGLALMLGGVGLLAIAAVVFVLLYWPTARNEEAVLESEFPQQWAAYKQRTGIAFPRSWPQLNSGEWRLAQWRYNREYQMSMMTLAAVLALQLSRFI